jgi:D-ribose pyranase
MKKRGILHAALADVVAGMGHGDLLVVGDAGLPVPAGVPCIDLAVRCGLPPMLEVVRAVAEELHVETLTLANELIERDHALPAALRQCFPQAHVRHIPHNDLKQMSERARAIVRTGECTPYANVVLTSGVIF